MNSEIVVGPSAERVKPNPPPTLVGTPLLLTDRLVDRWEGYET